MNRPGNSKFIYLSIALCTFTYVLVRAITVGLTFDENWTVNGFALEKVSDILRYTTCDANNHILNTLSIKLLYAIFGRTLFVARIPNILAFILFLYFSYKLISEHLEGAIGYIAFLLLLFNPFLLDFFSIARGYGIALAFQMASLYYLLLFVRKKSASYCLAAVGMGALAVLANFADLNYFLSILFLTTILALPLHKKVNVSRVIMVNSIISVILATMVYEPIKKLKVGGGLFYGGRTGFYADTLQSLTKATLYNDRISSDIVHASLNVFLVIFFISLIVSLYRSGFTALSARNILAYVLILCCLSTISQHYLFGNPYLIDRTALFFYPLIILVLCLCLHDGGNWLNPMEYVIAAAFIINFCAEANFYKTSTWYFDAHTKSLMSWLNQKGKQENKVLKVGFSWPFRAAVNFYYEEYHYPFIFRVEDDMYKGPGQKMDLDYYIYLDRSLENAGYDAMQQKILTVQKDTALTYEQEGVVVFTKLR